MESRPTRSGAADESALAESSRDTLSRRMAASYAAAEASVPYAKTKFGAAHGAALAQPCSRFEVAASGWRACMHRAQTLAVAVPSEVLLLHSEIGLLYQLLEQSHAGDGRQ